MPPNKDRQALKKAAVGGLGSGMNTRVGTTWTPKVCKIMAFEAVFGGFWLLFYILLGSRYDLEWTTWRPKGLSIYIVTVLINQF